MIHSSSSSSSSWFCSSDFEDKGVFSTGAQKVYAFAEKRGEDLNQRNIRTKRRRYKKTKYNGNEDVNTRTLVVTTIDDDFWEKKKIAKNNNATKKKKKDEKAFWNYKTKDIASFFF